MDVAPPSSPGPRIEELGDTLVVTFRAHRSRGEFLFLAFWLTFWTFGGIAAMYALPRAGWGGRVFLLLWLCGWVLGEALAALSIAWQLAGRELLTVTPHQLEVRRRLGQFSVPTGQVHVLAIDDVLVERVPASGDFSRSDFRLRIVSHGETRLLVGEAMDEHEAEYVASVVRAYVHPRREWSSRAPDHGSAPPADLEPAHEPQPPLGRVARKPVLARVLPRVALPLIGAVILGFVAFVLLPLRHLPHLQPLSPPAGSAVPPRPTPAAVDQWAGGPPQRQQFDHPRAYAIATTRYVLRSAKTDVESAPSCGTTVTWTRWACHARASSRLGPFAGRSLVYRCSVEDAHQPPATAGQTILCGPERPPPITP